MGCYFHNNLSFPYAMEKNYTEFVIPIKDL